MKQIWYRSENLHWSIKHRICMVLLFDLSSSPHQPSWLPFQVNSPLSDFMSYVSYSLFSAPPIKDSYSLLIVSFLVSWPLCTCTHTHTHAHTHICTYKLNYTVLLWEKTYSIYCSGSSLCCLKWWLQFCLCCCKCCCFIFPHDLVRIHWVYVPWFLYSLISWWAHRLVLTPGYCE